MRPPLLLGLIVTGAIAAAACNGSSNEAEPTPTTAAGGIPTATPYAVEPEPIIVTDPTEVAREVVYVVQPGDTLSEIARTFETTIQAIMDRNGLTDATLIFVDQELVIPSATPPPDESNTAPGREIDEYVVRDGDTGSSIARQFGTTVEALAAANDRTVEQLGSLRAGELLNLPRPQ